MLIRIKKEVFSRFNPDFKLVMFKLTDIDNETKLKEAQHLLKEIEELTKLTSNKENVKNHYLISPWVIAQQKFGVKAKHYHTSVERLLNKVLKNKTVADNEVLTNILRYISLKYLVPIGVDDIEKVQGNLTFELATGKEKIGPLKTIKKEAFYYHDQKNVLGTKLDYWKSKRTLLTRKSTSALIHFEILPPLNKKEMDPIIKETKELIKVFCGGKIKNLTLDKKRSNGKI